MLQIFLLLAACNIPHIPTDEEIDKHIYDDMVENVKIYKPRENVECYIFEQVSPSRPRSISCVVLPQPVKP